jgi:hypothetical protein
MLIIYYCYYYYFYFFVFYLFIFSNFDMMLLLFYSNALYHQQETYDELAFGHDATQVGLRKKVKEPNTW